MSVFHFIHPGWGLLQDRREALHHIQYMNYKIIHLCDVVNHAHVHGTTQIRAQQCSWLLQGSASPNPNPATAPQVWHHHPPYPHPQPPHGSKGTSLRACILIGTRDSEMTPSAHRNPFPSICSMSLKVQRSPLIGNYRVLSFYPHKLDYWKCFNGFFFFPFSNTSASALKNTGVTQQRRQHNKDSECSGINRIHTTSVL